MPDIWSADKLLLFIGFVIPGFISLKTYELLFPGVRKESSKQIIDAIAYSCLNYALLFWPIYEVEIGNIRAESPRLYLAFYACVLFVAPVAWVCLYAALRRSRFSQKFLPHPTGKAWDFVFSRLEPYWVIATLRDNTKIAGRFGSSSFASSAPEPQELYLEEAWVLNEDGGFERPRTDTGGILILASDLVSVELFRLTYGGQDEQKGAAAHDRRV